jgi:hypothetical protein
VVERQTQRDESTETMADDDDRSGRCPVDRAGEERRVITQTKPAAAD